MQLTADFDASEAGQVAAAAQPAGGAGDPDGRQRRSLLLAGQCRKPPDGSPILLISRLALHTKNILADARVSLMLDERAAGDPLEGARIMLAGRAEEAAAPTGRILRRRYLNAHPSAEVFVDFKDFSFFRIRPQARIWSPVLAGSSTSSRSSF